MLVLDIAATTFQSTKIDFSFLTLVLLLEAHRDTRIGDGTVPHTSVDNNYLAAQMTAIELFKYFVVKQWEDFSHGSLITDRLVDYHTIVMDE